MSTPYNLVGGLYYKNNCHVIIFNTTPSVTEMKIATCGMNPKEVEDI